ncbi:MAG: hypothetical protein V7745_07240 [Pseudomonadales bacterium]
MDDDIERLTASSGCVLYTSSSPDKFIEVRQLNRTLWMHFGDDAVQGCMSLDHPYQLLLLYTEAMLASFLFVGSPQRVLNLGVGCGSFERFFQTKLPGLQIDSVDSCQQVIELAKRFFKVARKKPLICEHAETFVTAGQASYDVIFCDLHADNSHPACLFDSIFYGNCYERLSTDGVMVVNLLLTEQSQMLKLLQTVREHFDTLVLMAVPNHKNTLLFALKGPFPDEQAMLLRAKQLLPVFGVDLKPYIDQFKVFSAAPEKI